MSWGIPGSASLPPPLPGQGEAGMELPKAVVRVGEQAMWSTQQLANAAATASTQNRLFTVQRGQTGQGFGAGLSLPETSLKEAGRVPGGYAYDVFAIACQPYYPDQWSVVSADLNNILNNGVLSWDFLQTIIDVAPIQLIGAGGGAFGDSADTGAAEGGLGGSRINLNNGNGQLWIYRLHPVMLSANATFAMVITWGVAATVIDGGTNNSALNIRICLMGRFKTAIAVG